MTTSTSTTPEATDTEADKRKEALRKAYSNATAQLREAHRTEFDDLYSKAAEALGVTYTPRLTPEQKAEKDLADLLEKFPNLAEKVTGGSAVTGSGEPKSFDTV